MYIVDTHQHEGGGGVQVDHCRPGNLEREVGGGRWGEGEGEGSRKEGEGEGRRKEG